MLGFFRRLLSARQTNDGYITIIYPVKNEGVVINDTLSAAFYDSLQCNVVSAGSAVDSASCIEVNGWSFVDVNCQFDAQPTFCINPATGLPMVDDFVDVGGNVFGFSSDL
ncbi:MULTISPECIES: hypothetical protein [Stutzerimonas stutzeri subgroup]|uniref:hypothetical protein n=1 Tax=Stutzerimonas stutzeri subgroup TaxID=578833 RepID=UPI000CE57957|nr:MULTISPECIES: hypothetical protein [Stutzerimonas stutzeri subgroup]